MIEFFERLFDSDFMPHGHCYAWTPSILWLHVISDLVIAAAYYSIPIALYVVVRRRKDISFSWIITLFALFILACGTTHLFEVWNVWNGTYRLAGIVKAVTAVLSISTAYFLWRFMPILLNLPSIEQVQKFSEGLEREVLERKLAEERVLAMNLDLEQKISTATAELRLALSQKEEILIREREAHADSERASRLKDEFVATLSHELRTPLNAISTWSQLLVGINSVDARVAEAVPVIQRNVKHLVDIIDDLLDMSSILSGSIKLHLVDINFKDVVESALVSLEPAAAAKNISFKRQFEPIRGIVRGDATRIRQIIWNIVHNAIKFSINGGVVSLEIKSEQNKVKLIVRDNGRGISGQFLPYVFDRFRQEMASTNREYAGLGLGLSLAKQLAELHQGEIEAFSAGEGLGAEFIFTLPILGQ